MFGVFYNLATVFAASGNAKYDYVDYEIEKFEDAISPKAVVVSLFAPESEIWHEHLDFTHNITLPGLSPLFPNVYCTENYEICNIVTGEGEINAAATTTAFLASAQFNLTETYFLVAGIAGIDPNIGTLGSAAFAQYTVQVAQQYQIDIREAPSNWTTGYWAYGTDEPGEYPEEWYGTEVFEVNADLRDRAAQLAYGAKLADSAAANKTRALFSASQAARLTPGILKCDIATSDVYFTGDYLTSTFANTTKMDTNGSATYCMTAQEDSAVLEAALRNAKFGLTDFSRWVLMRTGSDFDRQPSNESGVEFFDYGNTGGFEIAIENLYIAGFPFINDIITNWNSTYKSGTFVVGEPEPVLVNETNSSTIIVSNYTLLPNYTNWTSATNTTNATNATNGTNTTNSTAVNGTYAPQNYIGDVFGTLEDDPNFGNYDVL